MVRNTALTLSLIALLGLGLYPSLGSASNNEDCIDCDDDAASETEPATNSRGITLFTPGRFDSGWLQGDHPGAQAMGQGEPCSQCHQGKERDMGENIAVRGQTASRDMDISFTSDQDNLYVTLSWQASTNAQQVAIMWDNGGNAAFSRSGCWASCHSDMSGMREDGNPQQGKYLKVARSGQSTSFRSSAELQALRAAGNFVEIWQVSASGDDEGTSRGGAILDQLNWYQRHPLTADASYAKGRWEVTFSRSLKGGPGGSKSFLPGKKYTFGVALQGSQEESSAHWVSLPMSFSLAGDDTDFVPAPE